MSREIKLRVWDGKDMREPPPLNEWDMEDGEFWVEYCDNPIMQFTGLQDRHGKDIYEGDVVEAKSWNPMRYTVEFIEGGFCFTHPKLKGSPIDVNMMFSSVGCACEVIGNIHENPELLKP